MGKGIAIPYVIALILGVAIVGLIGFWFASTGGKFSGQSQSTYCQSELLKYCTKLLAGASPSPSEFSGSCGAPPASSSDTECKNILGTSGGGGGPSGETPVATLKGTCVPTPGCDTAKKLECVDKVCKGLTGYDVGDATCTGNCKSGTCSSGTICS